MKKIQLGIRTKYTLSGMVFGLIFPVMAWMLDIINSNLTFSVSTITQIHQNNFLHYIVDLAPFILGTVFYYVGKVYQRQPKRNFFSSLLTDNLVSGSTLRFKIVTSLLLVLILLFLGISSWYIQQTIQLKSQQEIGRSLDTILTTTEQAAYFRLKEEQSHVLTWAQTEYIVQAAQELIPQQDFRQNLITSPAQNRLRTWFEPIQKIRGYQGFFIISPKNINLASGRNIITGKKNILTQHHRGFLEKIWQGDTAWSTPHHAHVTLLNPEGKTTKGLITMLVGAPIKNELGEIIAILAFRLDPYTDLSPIFHQGRIGESGETYAFIKEGEMITLNRFDQSLVNDGVLLFDASGIVHLEVRDPGVNLTQGEQTNIPRKQQPFTRMAISAMKGNSGQDLKGYRDYRGVPVIGSWLWSNRLGFGMATEIDVDEAYALLNFNREIITISSFVLGILSLAFFAIFSKYIHESRKSKQILIDNDQTTRLLLNSTGEGIYGIDLNGECIFANKTCLKLLGYHPSEDELLGENTHYAFHHTRKDGTPYPIEECKIFQSYQKGEAIHVDDEVMWHKDGSSFFSEYRAFPIKRHGKIFGSVVSFTDITEKKQIELEREESAAERAQLIDAVNVPLFGIDTQGHINEWNQTAVKIFNYSKDDIMGHNWVAEFISDEYKKPVKEILDNALKGKEIANYEFPLYSKEGKRIDILLNATTRRDVEGNITGVIGVGQDITELRIKEKALNQMHRMEAVGQLTGGIAHDFNNLLSIISGNLHFLQQDIGKVSVEINELFEDAMSAVNEGSELTQHLLTFSNQRKLISKNKNANEIIKSFTRFLSRTLGGNIKLDLDLPDQNFVINIDQSQLENALLNLAINARDAMQNNGRITIKTRRYHHAVEDNSGLTLPGGDYILISVSDTGSGIGSEVLQHVFEPFFTTKNVDKGTGLGLSIIYGFIHQSNGGCYIDSTPGVGTTVSMYFPEIKENETIDKKLNIKEETSIRGSDVVLIVEDEARVRKVTLRNFKNLGYKTLEAENADMARAIIESGTHIDLLFSDVLMPGEMDGHMLAKWTKENHPEIKIILASGYSKKNEDETRLFAIIRKPYTIEMLSKQIRATL